MPEREPIAGNAKESAEDTGTLQPGSQPPAPIAANAIGNGAKVCARCRTENPADGDRCARCRAWLPANQAARKHGTYAKQQPTDVLMTADELLDGVLSDKGGAEDMSTLERSLAAKLRDTDILLALNKRTLIAEGVDSPTGRKAHERYLQALDRFLRIAATLGLGRRAKDLGSLSALEYARRQQQRTKGAA